MRKLIFIFVICMCSSVYGAEKTILLPFEKGRGITEQHCRAVYDSFRKTVSGEKDYELVSHEDTVKGIEEGEFNRKKFAYYLDLVPVGKYFRAAKIIHGRVFMHKSRVNLQVFFVDVNNGSLLNRVFLNVPESFNPFIFGKLVAQKLLWIDRSVYPNRAVIESNRRIKNARNSGYYQRDMKAFLARFKFPRSTEIISVMTFIKEKKKVSAFGCIGCVTLVGWVFLPYYTVKSEITALINIRYIDRKNVYKRITIKKSIADKEHYHVLRSESTMFGTTERVYLDIKKELEKDIRSRKELFVETIQ